MTDATGMRRWVVTGPTGAGKTLLTRALVERGAVAVFADGLGHALLDEEEVRGEIRSVFGESVFAGGKVERGSLGRVVFADRRALARLEAIVHPRLADRIGAELDEQAATGRYSLAVLEAAVYFLLPSIGRIDLVICVTATEDVRRERLVEAGLSPAAAAARIAAQVHLDRDWPKADRRIRNEGDDPGALDAAADELLAELDT